MPQQVDKYGVPIRTAAQQAAIDKAAALEAKYPSRSGAGIWNDRHTTNVWQWGKNGQPELVKGNTVDETRTLAGKREWFRYEPSDYKNFDPDVGKLRRTRIVDSRQVTQRDATIAKNARQTLAERAGKFAEKAQSEGPNILSNPIIGIAGLIAEADRATGYKRAQYTGNFGGPSFATNPYASSTLAKQIRAENAKRKK